MSKLYAVTAGHYSDYHIIALCKINEVRVHGDGSCNVYVVADDTDKALKIARDLVAEYKAEK